MPRPKKETKKTAKKTTLKVKKKETKKETKTKTKTKVKETAEKKKTEKTARKAKYWEGVGRRKTAVARVRIVTRGKKEFLVNEKKLEDYFSVDLLDKKATAPLDILNLLDKFKVSVRANGGGIDAQAEAIRHGLSRALVKFNPNFRKKLKKAGFLTRDPRMKERKKFGLKKARKAPQWSKR